jgi:DNA polymerase bacteriophage-type
MMLWLDTETYCEVPIQNGTYKYTRACEVMIVTYAIDDGPVKLWDRTAEQRMPGDLLAALTNPSQPITAHNAMFDRNVLRYGLGEAGIDVPIPRWRCTMAQALAHGLPGGLDPLCGIMGVEAADAKHQGGKRFIHLFCKPQPANRKLRRATRLTHPKEWQAFRTYAAADISAMREVARKLPAWNWQPADIAMYHLDQRINDRGFYVDVPFATAAIRAVDDEQKRIAKRVSDATNGAVASATQRDALLYHILSEHGVDLPDMQKDTLERRINDPDLPAEVRELLSLRLSASTSSTAKYASLLRGLSNDHRMRGTLQFNGAARTRRWAGRTFQPQNMPRQYMKPAFLEMITEAVKAGCEHLLLPDVMDALRQSIRSCLIAAPGRKLVIADLANIEGRVAAWFAGEEWKLKAFRDYDAGIGPDLYKISYASTFGVSIEDVGYFERQIGKVCELMLQYGGGVGAFITGAAAYGIDLNEMADAAEPGIPADVREEAEDMFDWFLEQNHNTFGLTRRVFVVCDCLKRMWRRRHPGIVALWAQLQASAVTAIENQGNTISCGMFSFRRDNAWLKVTLPSGSVMCYPSPRVINSGVNYMGVNPYSRKWSRIKTYPGKWLENFTQAFAGDILKANLPAIEAEGYEPVMLVHDEDVTETPDTPEFSVARLIELMTTVPAYAKGLPLAAAGREGNFYRKEKD